MPHTKTVSLLNLTTTFGTGQKVGNSAFVFAITYIAIGAEVRALAPVSQWCYFVPVPSVFPILCLNTKNDDHSKE